MKRNFSEKYKTMINRTLRMEMLDLEEGCYFTEKNKRPTTPSKYRRDFVQTQDDFVTKFCEDY